MSRRARQVTLCGLLANESIRAGVLWGLGEGQRMSMDVNRRQRAH